MKIGMIARADNSGLGTLSRQYGEHLEPTKVLIVQNGKFPIFPERYDHAETRVVDHNKSISKDDMEWLLKDIDVLFSIETFYNWGLVIEARKKKVKTALLTMCEMMQAIQEIDPDLYICPSKLDLQMVEGNRVYLPAPIDTERIVWKERKTAKTFIHVGSHGGMSLRKGTHLLLAAMPFVKSDIKLIIYTWLDFETNDPRIEIKRVQFKNYWQLYDEGDAIIYPQDYNGICLPVVEAFSSGMGVFSTDIFPFNEYLPNDLLFKPHKMYRTAAAIGLKEVDAAIIRSEDIAAKIDEYAGQDISKYSKMGKEWAEDHSWKVWKPKYLKTLKNLCEK